MRVVITRSSKGFGALFRDATAGQRLPETGALILTPYT